MTEEMVTKLAWAIANLGDTFREFGMDPPKAIVCSNRSDADLLRYSQPPHVTAYAVGKPHPLTWCCEINGMELHDPRVLDQASNRSR